MAKLQGGTTIYGALSTVGVVYASGGNFSTSVIAPSISATSASFSTSISAPSISGTFYGTAVGLSGVVGTDSSKLSLSGGTLTGALVGTSATFTTSISSPSISGTLYGDGSNLININASVNYVIDGGGSAITAGSKGFVQVPTNFIVKEWSILADTTASSFAVDVRKCSYDNLPTTSSIVGSDYIQLTNQQKNHNLSVSWSAISAGEFLEFYVTQNSSNTLAYISLKGIRN
jgi:hypothetical protein